MGKPRKLRPKQKQRLLRQEQASPRRAWTPSPRKPHFEDVLATVERFTASALCEASEFAATCKNELASITSRLTSSTAALRHRVTRTAITVPYSRDERHALGLLFLPFLLVASAIIVHQSVSALHTYLTAITIPDEEAALVRSATAPKVQPAPVEAGTIAEVRPVLAALGPTEARTDAPATSALGPPLPQSRAPASVLAVGELGRTLDIVAEAHPLAASAFAPPDVPSSPATLANVGMTKEPPVSLAWLLPPAMKMFDVDKNGNPIRPGICTTAEAQTAVTPASFVAPGETAQSLDADAFGLRLAQAAESQVGSFVIYDDRYRSISYPMGDVNSLYGVCTDVIVRAYRAMGVDLQVLVHQSRAGSGDRSIDHRRTEVLRRFLEKTGESLPITSFAESYRPGDIVTYYRPQNQRLRSHIAIVSSVRAPSGRLMIVHNRGWGPQLEDALFVDEITGHYRYRGPLALPDAAPQQDTRHILIKPALPIVPASLNAASQH